MKNKEEITHHFMEIEYSSFIDTLNGKDKALAASALAEIKRMREKLLQEQQEKKKLQLKNGELKKELELEHYRLIEILHFFNKWTEGFAELIKAPLNLEDDKYLRHHYFVLRDSCKNLVQSCRKKSKEIKERG